MASNASFSGINHALSHGVTSRSVIKRSKFENLLQQLPTANDIANPDCNRSFSNVPESIYRGIRTHEVENPVKILKFVL
jgi:hypothetical protein